MGEFARISDMELQTVAWLMFLSTELHKHISAVSGQSCGEGRNFKNAKSDV
jgi:hypothetical protein